MLPEHLEPRKAYVMIMLIFSQCFAEVKILSAMSLMGIYVKIGLYSTHGIECTITVSGGILM